MAITPNADNVAVDWLNTFLSEREIEHFGERRGKAQGCRLAETLFPESLLGEKKRDSGNDVAQTAASHRFSLAALDA